MLKVKPLIIAHRGASGESPENTFASFRLAIEQGCDAIELDVHLSADGELIVCHDDFINRTTNGIGKISDMTVSELKKYDAGIWYHERFKGEKIPLLEEVFDLVPKEVIINVEIKNIPSYYPDIERKLLELMIKKDRIYNVVISSFDHQCLQQIKLLEQEVKIGLLYSSNLAHHRGYANIFEMPVYSLHPYYQSINQQNIIDAINHGLEVYAWTVNEYRDMNKLIDFGVTGIITDFPEKLKKVLTERFKER
ncbi:MAG: glycerophosphoryl diester phosphodiesterase [Petroclostridium sp.]|jgi:glycerophosphoryl diester phosphodiesterase|uniref:glycerophosphodiester phosphodiesterase n=1 Tax=Petroclostridium xylanilyticum TaxID=1792311 RepID=UPI000B998522|nr:glycerophosphodiester phosphodiesterase [Petroclostridium xylanilyticum]MBZ4645997.1 glycerophosphoryl diester phosphodiesterase [Clostridia bacterium]MDK2810132.1 glycerophosphoryl diester phosphodiesterase [Petroclostridium sp.]